MVTRLQRILDPQPLPSLDEHLTCGGGHALVAAGHRTAESIIDLVERSGLRGRGGAGFPTGRKWRTGAASAALHGPPVLVVNAAEGEPGTFKDRLLLRRNPYRVLEGACIAARAIGANEIVIATKACFSIELGRIRRAVAEIEAAGWTAGLALRVVEGPDDYLFGEETALLEVIDDRPPFPRVAPPYRRGLGPTPTGPTAVVDNVETLANVPGILRHGSEWFRSMGTDKSPGTIICTVTGETPRHGVGEYPMGTPLRQVLDELGGTTTGIRAVLSGVSNPPLGPDQLDTALTYEAMTAAGSGLGSASFIVIDSQTSLHAVAAGVARFLSIESCGQCEPCKRDSLALAAGLFHGGSAGAVADRLSTVARGARCALAGQTERVVGGLLALDPTPSPGQAYPIVPLVEIDDDRALLDTGHLDKQADWTYRNEHAPAGLWPAQRLMDQPVEITVAGTGERDLMPPPPVQPATSTARFGPLLQHDDRLENLCDLLRSVSPVERPAAARRLHIELSRHIRVTQGLVYPLISRLAPGLDDDVTWYPAHHEQHAEHIIELLSASETVAPRQVDEICAAVHIVTRELEDRILPLLQAALDADGGGISLNLDGDLAELLDQA